MRQLTSFENLEVGKFYLPVFKRTQPLEVFGNDNDEYRFDSPYYRYLGGMEFENEYGDSVDGFYDPELQLVVATNAPDGFAE